MAYWILESTCLQKYLSSWRKTRTHLKTILNILIIQREDKGSEKQQMSSSEGMKKMLHKMGRGSWELSRIFGM
jgi:hypothetical protein